VNDASSRSQRPSHGDKQSFSPRCNPNQPSRAGELVPSGRKPGDRSYAETCNPSRTRTPLNEDQKVLATRYLPLARSMARRLKVTYPAGGDEFESTACLALVEAAQSFDPSRNVNFATFARYRIRGALRIRAREFFSASWRGDPAHVPTFQRLSDNPEAHGRVLGLEPDKPVGAVLEATDTLENWIKQLPRLHATAFRHIYLDGKSQDEAAALVGCSKSHLSRLHHEAITWLHETHELDRHVE
jgi:RNA polymerase sigma factor (sigma-70 family)